uniref:Uncharacterized protein n=1 Tax=Klebsiella phage BUCT640 TaxID=3153538 RepID=A0AAU7J888_9CAUD
MNITAQRQAHTAQIITSLSQHGASTEQIKMAQSKLELFLACDLPDVKNLLELALLLGALSRTTAG